MHHHAGRPTHTHASETPEIRSDVIQSITKLLKTKLPFRRPRSSNPLYKSETPQLPPKTQNRSTISSHGEHIALPQAHSCHERCMLTFPDLIGLPDADLALYHLLQQIRLKEGSQGLVAL
jgi:hypothetical protein